jgi:Prokaryotic E2 family A/ThiF family
MMANYLDPAGDISDANSLKGRLSTQLWDFLSHGLNSYARPIEVRVTSLGQETIVFDVDVEVSQVRVNDIRPIERLSVTFWGETLPEILALRADFPFVPHINPRPNEFPRSLCLYEESFEEITLRWTPAAFIERLRWWLSETAKGTLHGADQPLEPILIDHFATIVLPADLFTKLQGGSAQPLFISEITANAAYRASWKSSSLVAFAATVFEFQPHVHGIIRWRPSSLGELADQLQQVGTDFISALRIRVRELHENGIPLTAHLFLIAILPKQRVAGGAVEKTELWAFALGKPLSDIGEALGLWQMEGGTAGYLLGGSVKADSLQSIPIDILNPTFELTRDGAAALNGDVPSEVKVSAIGMGALGSQVTTHLVRSGFGSWTALDPDFLLPHNVARHELTASDVGRSKSAAMQNRLNSILAEPAMTAMIEANVVNPGERANQVRAAFENADVILDFSASLAVGRMLAHDSGVTRRCSVFLNPTGSDMVILCEDEERLCNIGASELLMPRKSIIDDARGIDVCIQSLDNLARRYSVSKDAMLIRLRTLDLWNAELSKWRPTGRGEFVCHKIIGARNVQWNWLDDSMAQVPT